MNNQQATINQKQFEPSKSYQPRLTKLEFSTGKITAYLDDGRILTIPITWFSKMRKAAPQQLNNYRILLDGYHIHWPELDEDISLRVFTDGLGVGCC